MASKEALLVAQTSYVFSMTYHGAAGATVDFQAEFFPSLFSKDVKVNNWDLRRTKFTYIAKHGLYPFFHEKAVKAMQQRPFSLNFDESTVNGRSSALV